jgi:hypothetical protein
MITYREGKWSISVNNITMRFALPQVLGQGKVLG